MQPSLFDLDLYGQGHLVPSPWMEWEFNALSALFLSLAPDPLEQYVEDYYMGRW